MWFHVAARTRRRTPDLTQTAYTPALWDRLRVAFPDAMAAVLMPDHMHLVLPATSADQVKDRLGPVLSGLSRTGPKAAWATLWEPISPAERVPNAQHLNRTVRYVALNPCRAGISPDPLCWMWSTHRDVVGAAAQPWVKADQLAQTLGFPEAGFVAAHHAYVSGDPDASVSGTPLPVAAPPADLPAALLADIAAAAAASCRRPLTDLHRRSLTRHAFVLLAWHQGWRDTALLARMAGVTTDAVRKQLARPDDALLKASALCLGDGRLLQNGSRLSAELRP